MSASAMDLMRTILEKVNRKSDMVAELLQEKVAALQAEKGRLSAQLAARDAEVDGLRADLAAAKVHVICE